LKENIVKILTNDDLQKRMGQSAREHVVKNYSWEKNAQMHYKLYKKVMSE